MGTGPEFASRAEAAEAVLAGLGYLAALDPAQLPACEQAPPAARSWSRPTRWRRRRGPGSWARSPPRRATTRTVITAPRSWLTNRTRGHQGRRYRATWLGPAGAAHPRVIAALAATGQIRSPSAAQICDWTGQLPGDCQDSADAILVAAALSGASLEDLARLAAEIYARSRPAGPRRASRRVR